MKPSSGRLPPKDQLVMGIHTLQELLRYAPDRLLCVYTVHPRGERKTELLSACEKKGIPIRFVSLDDLTYMAGSDSHQSFVAHIKGRKFYDVKEFLKEVETEEKTFVLMLDQIFDPQNFGALLRSAECFGANAVAWSKNRGCDLNPVVTKASCGASELMPLIRISNLADSVDKFQEAGFEVLVSLLEPKAQNALTYSYANKTVLIVGSEGEGIQPLIQKKADRSIYIPMAGKIQSLNVAQATAVLLSRWRKDSL